jgi:hypothetical protein
MEKEAAMSDFMKSPRAYENRAKMILWLLILPLILVSIAGKTSAPPHRATAARHSAQVVESYGKLPLAFETNHGQTDAQVKFLSRGAGYSLFLTSTEAVLTLGKVSRQEAGPPTALSLAMKNRPPKQEAPSVIRMKLLGASTTAEVTGQDELPGKSNYFLGNDPQKWHIDIPQYAKVRYENVYPGVDLVYYGNQRELEYDFVVQPSADPNVIRLGIDGAQDVRLDQGDLVLTSAAGDVHLCRPRIFQETSGIKHDIGGGYVLKNKNEAGFRIASYDPSLSLVIDPVLAYSTYLGGSGDDFATGIAVDLAGSAYVTGKTAAADFPTRNAIQPTNQSADAFVTKFNSDGTALIYSTFLGGMGGDWGRGIAVDSAGNAYVTGGTNSNDFPINNAFQGTLHGYINTFVTKINASGTALAYSTYLGGSYLEEVGGIAVDTAGNAYVTGQTGSSDFPTLNAIQPTIRGAWDAFVTKINGGGNAVYSTYLGGSGSDSGSSIAADAAGNVYIAGQTDSNDFPVLNAIQSTNHGYEDVFVTKINASGGAIVYSTYLGGSGHDGGGIALDAAGNAYVAGGTSSTDFPVVNAIQATNHGGDDAFVTKINVQGSSLVYSTYLGGSGDESAVVRVDSAGNVYLAGSTKSTDFPTFNALQPTRHGRYDAFVAKINLGGNALAYSTYLGGSLDDNTMGVAVDAVGSVYITGATVSGNFPTTPVAFQRALKPIYNDAFVTKIAQQTFVGISPAKLTFGTEVIGATSMTKKVTVTNQGSSTLVIKKIFIGGANGSDFAETNNCPPVLSAGGFCTVSITFTPTAQNKRQAAQAISDSDPASPQALPLSGVGTVVGLSAKSLAFGKVPVGSTSLSKTVTLTNVGSTQLNFAGISITGTNPTDYSQSNSCGVSIATGATCTITVTFKPTAIGTRSAAVSISDDGGGSPQKIALSGTGV